MDAYLTEDIWLSAVIRRPAFVLDTAGVSAESSDSLTFPAGFITARVPTDEVKTAQWLEQQGFCLVDTNVTLEKPAPTLAPDDGGDFYVRAAQPGDGDSVADLARNGFDLSRFHLDPAFDSEVADRIKSEWARNFFRGERGDAMTVAASGDRVVGFLQLLRRGSDLIIDLIATDPDWRDKGVGREMITLAETATPGIERLRVGTQAANTESLAFYESLGFRIKITTYVFHRHC